jgi:acyl-CoA hydrolase
MMPTDANILGNVFGGAIMRYMDEVAAIVAWRHAERNCVTASIDRMNFWKPVFVGNVLILRASVNYVGETSMEIGVRIEAQDPSTHRATHTGSCYLTYVAIDARRRPVKIPKIRPVNAVERRRFREAITRRKLREVELEALRENQD